MLNSSLPVRRSVFVALALLAVTLVLSRQVCDLWFTHAGAGDAVTHAQAVSASEPVEHGGHPAVQCCASVGDANLIAPLRAALGGPGASQGLAPAALLAVVADTAILARQLHWLRGGPRSPLSFYLRSARILR